MQETGLGYASKFVEKPRLKRKHSPRGPHRTPPALKGTVYHRGRRYNYGYRVMVDGFTEIVHVGGVVYPKTLDGNVFKSAKDGIRNFVLWQRAIEEQKKEG
jgi:hypothetical protein